MESPPACQQQPAGPVKIYIIDDAKCYCCEEKHWMTHVNLFGWKSRDVEVVIEKDEIARRMELENSENSENNGVLREEAEKFEG